MSFHNHHGDGGSGDDPKKKGVLAAAFATDIDERTQYGVSMSVTARCGRPVEVEYMGPDIRAPKWGMN